MILNSPPSKNSGLFSIGPWRAPVQSPLPAQALAALPQRIGEARKGLKYLSAVDRLGSNILISLKAFAFEQEMRRISGFFNYFIDSPTGRIWAQQDLFDKTQRKLSDDLLKIQEPGCGREFLLKCLPFIIFAVLLVIHAKLAFAIFLLAFGSSAAYRFVYTLAPDTVRQRIDKSIVGRFAASAPAQLMQQVFQGMRAFLLLGLYLSVFTLPFLMLFYWLGKATGLNALLEKRRPVSADCLLLPQNLQSQQREAQSFFDTPAFALTTMGILLSGLPAMLTYWLYATSGVDVLLGSPMASMSWWQFYLRYFYIVSAGCGLAILFFKAWLTFPLNFINTRYDIMIDAQKIVRGNVRGWFADAMVYGFDRTYHGGEVKWCDVTEVIASAGAEFRLYPLPAHGLAPQGALYRSLNSIARVFDALIVPKIKDRIIKLKTDSDKSIEVRAFELSEKQRVDLYSAIRKYAPQAVISEDAQIALVGKTALSEPRHTALWFNLLTCHENAVEGELISGTRLDNARFEVFDKIASGGQATVYDALDHTCDEQVIIKEFVLADGNGMEALLESTAEFEAEGTILSRLDHPQIVKLKAMFIEHNRAYLAIERAHGKTLRKLVDSAGAMPQSTVVNLAIQMCEILAYLSHLDPPVVHRDFTPDNLLLDDNGRLKLIDFSISQLLRDKSTGECAGKHSYTPPEQYRGQATLQSDIYALGATLHFLLTGSDPVPISVSHPAADNSCVSQPMDAVVAHATAIDLASRYDDVSWILIDLADIQKSEISGPGLSAILP